MAVTWTIPQVEYDLSVTQDSVDYTNVIKAAKKTANEASSI